MTVGFRVMLGALALVVLASTETAAMSFICPLVVAGAKYYPARTEDAPDGRPVDESDLGPLLGMVSAASLGLASPGCSSSAPTGRGDIPVYAFRDYRSQFRLIVRQGDRLRAYEVVERPGARRGADLLDIAGRVTRVTIKRSRAAPPTGSHSLQWRVDVVDPRQVKDIVDLVLAGPLRKGASDSLIFHMTDGTIVERHYHPSDGTLRGPIYVQELRALMDEVFESSGIRFDDCGPDPRP